MAKQSRSLNPSRVRVVNGFDLLHHSSLDLDVTAFVPARSNPNNRVICFATPTMDL